MNLKPDPINEISFKKSKNTKENFLYSLYNVSYLNDIKVQINKNSEKNIKEVSIQRRPRYMVEASGRYECKLIATMGTAVISLPFKFLEHIFQL